MDILNWFPVDTAFIGGQWVRASGGGVFSVADPADGAALSYVADMDERDAEIAIEAAHEAFGAWRATTADHRARILRRWFDLIVANTEALAQAITAECGKPIREARGEVAYGAGFVEWFAEEARRAYGDVIPSPFADSRLLTIKQPVGVAAAITPWNFPLAMITRKCAPAMAAGCTIVLKPAEATPLTALALAALARQAGVPDGVFNVVTTANAASVGNLFCTHKHVRKLSFTGSTKVGRTLYRQCANNVTKLSLELGGNAPFIVFDDADMDAAIEGAVASKFRNSGQTCVCANRFLVQAGVYDVFIARLSEAVSALHVAPGKDEAAQIGPLINLAGLEKVEGLVANAVSAGARIVCGGARHEMGGHYYQPTVLADVTPAMDLSCQEIFGPVAPVLRFETEADAIEMANDTPYGLAAYLYSRDVGRCFRVGEALESGMVGVNTGILSTEVAPFGGVKESGLGREGGRLGLEEYMETKYLRISGMQAQ